MAPRTASDGNTSIALIVLAAIGSTLFTLCAGTLVYRSSDRLITAAHWVEHTHEVLTSLQSATQYVDRVESSSRLYLAGRDLAARDRTLPGDEQLNTARGAVLRLEAAALRVHGQVADNPGQTTNVANLEACATRLGKGVDALAVTGTEPRDALFSCRQTINAMSEIEKKLLQQRTETSQANAALSLNIDLGFAAVSVFILFVLFALLLRDALSRRRIARTTRRVNQELARSIAALEDQALESQRLTAVRDELQLCTSLDQIYAVAARGVAQLLPGSRGSLGMIDNSRHLVEAVSHWNDPEDAARHADPAPNALPDFFSPTACCGLRAGSLRWRRKGQSEIHCQHFEPGRQPASYICLPMVAYGETIGILFVEIPLASVEKNADKRLHALGQMMQLISISIASLQFRLKLEQQSIRDPLTGLFNRHFMEISLQKELARGSRRQSPLAIFMLDIDHFKTFNDRCGHPAGDTVLQSVAAVLQSSLRAEDIVCRYGGEEFLVILPDVDSAAAATLAERIRLAVAAIPVDSALAAGRPITVSIGCALTAPSHADPAELIHRADLALYRAKHEGRNRVVFHTASPSNPDSFALLESLATA